MSDEKSTMLVLAGPTASGKGEVARRIAPGLGAEIISLDSMKIFRDLDICTAKPGPSDRAAVPHHLIDIVDPWEEFSVARWLPLCEEAILRVQERGHRPLLVVGTPLYLRSLIYGLFPGPSARWDLRARWLEEARDSDSPEEGLHGRLKEVDPESASRIHPNDVRRILRALEVHVETGRSLTELQEEGRREPPRSGRMVGILWSRADLHRRIERRVDAMFRAGMVDEVRRLRSAPRPLSRQALQAVGLKEVLDALDRGIPEDEAIERVQRRTRRLARHQMTWFRKFEEITWIDATRENFPDQVADDVEGELSRE